MPYSLRKIQMWSSFFTWVANVPRPSIFKALPDISLLLHYKVPRGKKGQDLAVVGNGILPIVKMLSIHRIEG